MNESPAASDAHFSGRLALRDGLLVAAVLLLAAVLRFPQAGESLWIDELHTSWTVADGPAEISSRAQYGNQSPCYFYLAWAAVQLGGDSEWALRAPSLAASLLLIPLGYCVVLQWTGSRGAALLAAVLLALDRDALFYSLEARPYALVQLVGLLHVWLLWRVVEKATPTRRCAMIATAVLLFHLHYTAALLLAAELVWLAATWRARPHVRPYDLRMLAIDVAVVILLCLPAAGNIAAIAARKENWEKIVARQPAAALLDVFPLDVYLLLPAAILLGSAAWRRIARRPPYCSRVDWRVLLLAACWLFVPLAIAWTATNTDVARIFMRRYVMACGAAPAVLAGMACALCRERAARAVCLVAVAAAAAAAPGALWSLVGGGPLVAGPAWSFLERGEFIDRPREDWRSAVGMINNEKGAARLPVLVRSGLIEDDALRDSPDEALRRYCLLPVRGMYQVDEASRELIPLPSTRSGQLDAQAQRAIVASGGAWLLLRARQHDAQGIIDEIVRGLERSGAPAKCDLQTPLGDVTLAKVVIAGE